MSSDPALEIAETLQTSHLNRHPDPQHDINPTTSASARVPVDLGPSDPSNGQRSNPPSDSDGGSSDSDIEPYSTIRPVPRRPVLPPLPDMRFEQSYLKSIEGAGNWQTVAFITVRDQILMPLVQGMGWQLALAGWKHWNKSASMSGRTLGSKIRRWWYGVNDWEVPASIWDDPQAIERKAEKFFTQ